MSPLALHLRWLGTDLPEPEEAATFAELGIEFLGEPVSDIEDVDTDAVERGPRLPVYGLGLGIAGRWWVLLHEAEKQSGDIQVEARHRLDAFTAGYVFPPIALWSAGSEGLAARIMKPDLRFQRQRFRLPDREGPWFLPRDAAEQALRAFMGKIVDRLGKRSTGKDLRDAWDRVLASLDDPDEAAWCAAAGRLGFDPYDPDTPDIDALAGELEPGVFAELCEAATVEEIPAARDWVGRTEAILDEAPSIDVADFGGFPSNLTQQYAAHAGYEAADRLRKRLGLDPRGAVDRLIGASWTGRRKAPRTVQGLARRTDGAMRAVVAAGDHGQHRFRMCHALFLGWQAGAGEERLVTPAKTWPQQAGKAFAAEMLAPAAVLREAAGGAGLSGARIRKLAGDLRCQEQVIRDQAWNHRIRLAA